MRYNLLAEIYVVQKSGLPLGAQGTDKARRALSLAVQGMQYQDPDDRWWEFGTVLHADRQAMIGRREVCAEEGHVIPEKPKGTSFGCARCDYTFVGRVE